MRGDLSEQSVTEQSWVLQKGSYPIYVGSNRMHLPLTGFGD
jgi:hypothetical protein